MKSFSELARSVKFTRKGKKILLNDKDQDLVCVGKGRSAYAFKIQGSQKVIKVFFEPYESLAKEEAEVYKVLQGNSFYPNLYECGSNYLVIDYISGNTMFDCLVKGIQIKEFSIQKVDEALAYAKQQGLNPSDIHLRNIFITNDGRIKLIDVARYRQIKHCSQWDDLKKAYKRFYQTKIFPKRAPEFILNLIAFLYKKRFIPSFAPTKLTAKRTYSQRL